MGASYGDIRSSSDVHSRNAILCIVSGMVMFAALISWRGRCGLISGVTSVNLFSVRSALPCSLGLRSLLPCCITRSRIPMCRDPSLKNTPRSSYR
jgi:hypothetical protein